MIKDSSLLAKKLGLKFSKKELFIRALTHRSKGANNNERLEYLGDSVLGFVIAERLFTMFSSASEGELSRLRASLVNQNSLAELAKQHEVGDYLILGSGELKSGGFRRDSILSDSIEAIMGALLLDQGIEKCRNWILALFSEKLAELDLDNWKKDPKTQLQEFLQARKTELPVYALEKMKGKDHAQIFCVRCSTILIAESCLGEGVSRKKAEQAAAEKMLNLFHKNNI